MKTTKLLCMLLLLLPLIGVPDSGDESVKVARFQENGSLILPDNFDDWVFIGTSLGMGYSQGEFNPDGANMFQVVRMEPESYQAFRKSGRFVDGTQLALHFFGSQNDVSINETGFVMGELHMAEIHYKDSKKFPDGFNFYTFNGGDKTAREVALPNDCVSCHKRDGAYDGVFVQFYPPIHEHLPEQIRSKLSAGAKQH